jgi:hypothetical protein
LGLEVKVLWILSRQYGMGRPGIGREYGICIWTFAKAAQRIARQTSEL